MKKIMFLLKVCVTMAVPVAFGLTSLVLMNTALFGLANGALARLDLIQLAQLWKRSESRSHTRRAPGKTKSRRRDTGLRPFAKQQQAQAQHRRTGPILGVTTVVGVTAWEIKDLCEIMICASTIRVRFTGLIPSGRNLETVSLRGARRKG